MDFQEQIYEFSNHINFHMKNIAHRHNLSFSQIQFLLSIPIEGISMSNLADRLAIDISTLSRNSRKLNEKELISQISDKNDSRISNIFLSKLGEEKIDLINASFEEISNQILTNLPVEFQQKLADTLEQINWSLTKHRGQ